MTSEVDICNLALQRLGARTISALTDDNTSARACNRVYEHARDAEIRSHPWNFARARTSLAALSTAPTFGYAAQYQLPADFIRLLPARNTSDLKKVTDPNEFDEMFIDLLVARIAMDIAEKVTQSNSKKQDATARYSETKKETKRINAFERPPQEYPADSWVVARL